MKIEPIDLNFIKQAYPDVFVFLQKFPNENFLFEYVTLRNTDLFANKKNDKVYYYGIGHHVVWYYLDDVGYQSRYLDTPHLFSYLTGAHNYMFQGLKITIL